MQGKQYLYMVQRSDGLYADFATTQFLQWTSAPTPLIYSPATWQDLAITEEMDAKYFGLNRTYGTPQDYVEDGAGILKTLFYTYGYNAQATLIILEQQLYFSDTEYGYYYTTLAKCSIDFTTVSHSGYKVSAQILEGDLKAMFQANESTDYEIPIDPSVARLVQMDGLTLKQYSNYIIQDPIDPSFRENGNNLIGLMQTSQEAKTQLGTQSVTRTRIDLNQQIYISGQQLLNPIPVDTDFTVSVDFGMTCTLAPGISPNPAVKYTLVARVFDQNGNIVVYPGNDNLLFEIDGPDALYNHRVQIKATKTFKLLKGYSVYLWSGINITNESGGEGATVVFFHYDNQSSTGLSTDSNVVINYNWIYKDTTILALTPLYILQYLVGKISSGKYTATSAFLSSLETIIQTWGTIPLCLYTSGDAVRGLTGAVLKISIDDFFKALNSTYGLGMGIINNTLIVEPRKYWVTPSNPAEAPVDLGPGSMYQCDPWTEVLFNTISIGSPNETYDEALGDINGRYEVNMTHHYGTPVLGINVDLDLTTKARRDMYGAEYARINLDGKTTTDSNSDNDMFELSVIVPTVPSRPGRPVTSGKYILDRTINPFVTGLLDNATAFNLKITPKHCLYRQGDYIRSVLFPMDSQFVTFTTADKNTPMITTYPDGRIVEERGNVEISNFAPRIFLPYVFTDTSPSPEAAIQGSTVKKFQFSYNDGRTVAIGTPLKITVQPADQKVQSLQLLATPDNNMLDFIDICN